MYNECISKKISLRGLKMKPKIMQDVVLKDEMQLMIKRNRRKDGKRYSEFVIEERRRGC